MTSRPWALFGLLLGGGCGGGTDLVGAVGDAAGDGSEARDVVGDGAGGETEADVCVPNCGGRACGDDGCGGACPFECSEGEVCLAAVGRCTAGRGWVQIPADSVPVLDSLRLAYDPRRDVTVAVGRADDPVDSGFQMQTWESSGGSWSRASPTIVPEPRRDFSMAHDEARGVTVLFGGTSDGGDRLNDTWEYDGTTWRRTTSAPVPAVGGSAAMTYDATRHVVVLVGITREAGPLCATWEYDGTRWARIDTPASPPVPYEPPVMAYDSGRGVAVLYESFGGPFSATWQYDGTTWTQSAVSSAPDVCSGHMVYEGNAGRILLVGGCDDGGTIIQAEMWTFDGAAWTQAWPAVRPRSPGPMAYDSRRGFVTLLDRGDSWEYDGETWSVRALAGPRPRGSYPMAFDSARRVTVLYDYRETWEYAGGRWNRGVEAPGCNSGEAVLVYDSIRGVVVLVCKVMILPDFVMLISVVEYNGSYWSTGGRVPAAAAWSDPSAVYDSARGVTVLVGSETGDGALDDMWEYDGRRWTEVTTAVAPPARAGHAMAYDSTRGVVVLFGGRTGPGDPPSYGSDTWEYDGTGWTEVTTPVAPPGRARQAMAYDATRGVVVLFGGRNEDSLGDTWEYDGTAWARIVTRSAPPPGMPPTMAYDSARGAVVLFESVEGEGVGETWEYYGP